MPGITRFSKYETSTESQVFSETENVSAILQEFPSQPVKLLLFNPSSNKIFSAVKLQAPHRDKRNEDIQNWDNELRNNFAPLSVHLEVIVKKFYYVVKFPVFFTLFSFSLYVCKSKDVFPEITYLSCLDRNIN